MSLGSPRLYLRAQHHLCRSLHKYVSLTSPRPLLPGTSLMGHRLTGSSSGFLHKETRWKWLSPSTLVSVMKTTTSTMDSSMEGFSLLR